jgi:hypothetical protein
MNPDDVSASSTDAQAAALAKLLNEQLAQQGQGQRAHEGQPSSSSATAEPTLFGLTMGGVFVAFVVSTVGLGLMQYGRSTSNITFAGFGLAMMTVPFFLTNTVVVGVVGALLLAAPIVMRRLQLA